MENSKVHIEKIDELLDELQYYSDILVKLNQNREEKAKKLQKVFKKNKNADEIKDFAFDSFFMSSFQNLDLQIIRAKFVSYVELYLFDEKVEPLSERVKEAYDFLKTKLPKRMFLAKDGKLVEIDSGSMDSKRKMYDSQNLFSMVERQVKQVMKNVSKSR